MVGVARALQHDVGGDVDGQLATAHDRRDGGPDDVCQLLRCHRTSVLTTPDAPGRAARLTEDTQFRDLDSPEDEAGRDTTAGTATQHRGEALAKDRTPDRGRTTTGAGKGVSMAKGVGKGATGSRAAGGARGGRTRPVADVVAPQRPWGLIAAAVAVVLFAAAVITYAVVRVNESEEARVDSVDEIAGIETYDYAAGQEHVTTPVDYTESPPVGGPHDGFWADCTGTVYDVDIRHENAVHSLEHGAVWITYDPERVSDADVERLAELVDGVSGRLMSPYAGLDAAVSLQSWNHQLKVDSADDPRIEQFADFLTFNGDVEGHYPEIGASCENPDFAAAPLVAGEPSEPVGPTDAPTTPTTGTDATTESTPQ